MMNLLINKYVIKYESNVSIKPQLFKVDDVKKRKLGLSY